VKSRAGFDASGCSESRRDPGCAGRIEARGDDEPVPIDAEAQAGHEFVASEEAVDAIDRAAVAKSPKNAATIEERAMPARNAHRSTNAQRRPRNTHSRSLPTRLRRRSLGRKRVPPRDAFSGSDRATKSQAESLQDALAAIRDDVDEQVLPIFLEEAAELYPQAASRCAGGGAPERRRASRDSCARTLHTFKGSARMAGAMRLGELAHRMESRLSSGRLAAAADRRNCSRRSTDLDRIGYVLDALREGKTNVRCRSSGRADRAPIRAAAQAAASAAATPSAREACSSRSRRRGAAPAAADVEPAPARCCACAPT
jgi:HPt (histidine-containing phosphotransfer) domain-containing protein